MGNAANAAAASKATVSNAALMSSTYSAAQLHALAKDQFVADQTAAQAEVTKLTNEMESLKTGYEGSLADLSRKLSAAASMAKAKQPPNRLMAASSNATQNATSNASTAVAAGSAKVKVRAQQN